MHEFKVKYTFPIRLNCGDPRNLLELFILLFQLIGFNHYFDYYASARLDASQLNRQIIVLSKRPLTHYRFTL